LPSVGFAFGALLLTTILWPVAAIVRRKNNLKLGLSPRDERGRMISRIATAAVTLVTVTWLVVFMTLLSKSSLLAGGLDPLLFLLHLLSLLIYVAGAGALLWAASVAWSGTRRWTGKVWTSVLALSAVLMLWMAWAYHLTSFASRY
jgi:hypothetical protein